MYTRVKICGLTRVEDVVLAAALGFDAIGLNFFSESKRFVTIEQAQQLIKVLPPFITVTGIFVNAKSDFIKNVLEHVHLDLLQFHGDESVIECESYHRPYIKTCSIKPDCDIVNYCQIYTNAKGILLDTHNPALLGGTGETFNWKLIPANLPKPIILAGGLAVENIKKAIEQIKPYAVDVCSGVEIKPGIKDPEKMRAFIQRVRNNDKR